MLVRSWAARFVVPRYHLIAPGIVVLGQRGVSGGELVTAAVELLRTMPPKGKLVTADAGLLCRPVVDTILAREGDYLDVVKDNQPELPAGSCGKEAKTPI